MSASLPAPRRSRLSRLQRSATTAVAGCGIAAIAFTLVPSASAHETGAAGSAAHWAVKANDVPGQAQPAAEADAAASQDVAASLQKTLRALAPESHTRHSERLAAQQAAEELAAQQAEAERAAAEEAAASRAAERETLAQAEAAAEAEAAAAEVTAAPEAPAPAETAPAAPAAPTYTDDLDGWIREALDIMAEHGIPGSYDGLYRNIMRESSGDPNAINDWDINWINGTPSIGLLQVIQPTFDAYHVEGTAYSLYDPVANIVAAANYAWDRYGSIDNVNGPY
ncbi:MULTISPECIES: transglycosylase SLT domain-containing protein [Streptomyces]|uniref:Transglycosylase SLT domain-containing protein n=1 Tax=Streptomyces harbinensis TaxID=1176198 RepID=A0A1I6RUI1_9ACTN|nr:MULTISPECIES: transglycosylase SLT domain-containing protein [Streptomyces]SFS68385.1 Transglycosylase SLT domain-containing protein [Streptomyces harbinensis]